MEGLLIGLLQILLYAVVLLWAALAIIVLTMLIQLLLPSLPP